jgi:hypothetical protein
MYAIIFLWEYQHHFRSWPHQNQSAAIQIPDASRKQHNRICPLKLGTDRGVIALGAQSHGFAPEPWAIRHLFGGELFEVPARILLVALLLLTRTLPLPASSLTGSSTRWLADG